jgi:hypothetical protein
MNHGQRCLVVQPSSKGASDRSGHRPIPALIVRHPESENGGQKTVQILNFGSLKTAHQCHFIVYLDPSGTSIAVFTRPRYVHQAICAAPGPLHHSANYTRTLDIEHGLTSMT